MVMTARNLVRVERETNGKAHSAIKPANFTFRRMTLSDTPLPIQPAECKSDGKLFSTGFVASPQR